MKHETRSRICRDKNAGFWGDAGFTRIWRNVDASRVLDLLLGLYPDPRIGVLADMFDQKVREHPDLGGQPDAVLVGDVHREERQFPVHQDRHELAGRNIALHNVERLNEETEAGEARTTDTQA